MRKHLDFIKAHYEKVILSVVLIGLAAAAALMPMKVSEEQQREEERRFTILRPTVREMQPIVLTNSLETLARVTTPAEVSLSGNHNVFNPVRWQRRPDGGVVRGAEAGISSLRVTNIEPLLMSVSYRRAIGSAEPYRYEIGLLNEVESPSVRPRLGEIGRENSAFKIESIQGPPEDPEAITLTLQGERTPITVGPNAPHERIVGYSASFYHDVERRGWQRLKVKDELQFGGESYNIVAITEDEVVLSARSNKKQTTIAYKPPQQ